MNPEFSWCQELGWITSIASEKDLKLWQERPLERQAALGCELRIDRLESLQSDLTGYLDQGVRIITPGESALERSRILLRNLPSGRSGNFLVDFSGDHPIPDFLSTDQPHIRSWHLSGSSSDEQVESLISTGAREGASAVKIVLPEDGLAAIRQARRIYRKPREIPLVIFAGGKGGRPSRIIALCDGQKWGYGRLLGSEGAAEGQLATVTTSSRYGLSQPGTIKVMAVVGADVDRSLSPGFHNRVSHRRGKQHLFLDISTLDPDGLLAEDQDMTFDALAVTQPHKGWARNIALPGSTEAARYPVWNTLWRDENGAWLGTNTDGVAIATIIAQRCVPRNASIVILGGGATATAIAIALSDQGRRAGILSRRPICHSYQKALEGRYEVAPEDAIATAQVLINATGAGGGDRPLPWSIARFRGELAIDVSVSPFPTDFLIESTAHGAQGIPGQVMFAEQARRQCRYFHSLEIAPGEATAMTAEALAEVAADSWQRARPELTR